MLLPKRILTPAEIAARRRNAQKSTGPRTPEGKRRASQNAAKWRLCPRERELELLLLGEDPQEFGRLHRELVNLLDPADPYLGLVVADLATVWWKKVRWLRAWPGTFGRTCNLSEIEQEIEAELERLLRALSLRSRKWYYNLTRMLDGPLTSFAALRKRIEARLTIFQEIPNQQLSKPAEEPCDGARRHPLVSN